MHQMRNFVHFIQTKNYTNGTIDLINGNVTLKTKIFNSKFFHNYGNSRSSFWQNKNNNKYGDYELTIDSKKYCIIV
jgi:hypothetical protein